MTPPDRHDRRALSLHSSLCEWAVTLGKFSVDLKSSHDFFWLASHLLLVIAVAANDDSDGDGEQCRCPSVKSAISLEGRGVIIKPWKFENHNSRNCGLTEPPQKVCSFVLRL